MQEIFSPLNRMLIEAKIAYQTDIKVELCHLNRLTQHVQGIFCFTFRPWQNTCSYKYTTTEILTLSSDATRADIFSLRDFKFYINRFSSTRPFHSIIFVD